VMIELGNLENFCTQWNDMTYSRWRQWR